MQLSRTLDLQERWATKKVLTTFVLVYFIFPLYLLPKILPEGRPLDLHFYYTPSEAFSLIESYGRENRADYMFGSATIDMLYPLCYVTFLGLVLTFFMVRMYQYNNEIQYLRLFPYCILLVDVFENLAIITMLSTFPDKNKQVAQLASILTSTKWLLFFVVMLMLVYFPIRYYQQYKAQAKVKNG